MFDARAVWVVVSVALPIGMRPAPLLILLTTRVVSPALLQPTPHPIA